MYVNRDLQYVKHSLFSFWQKKSISKDLSKRKS